MPPDRPANQSCYQIVLYPDPEEGGFAATVPLIPGLVVEGDTRAEVVAVATRAIRRDAEQRRAAREAVPSGAEAPRVLTVDVARFTGVWA